MKDVKKAWWRRSETNYNYDSEENECGLAEVLYRKNTLKALVIALTKLPYKSQNAQKSGHARWLTCY